MSSELTIGALARQVGVNLETIRYYERIGLMPRPKRTASGRRKYNENDRASLAFIRKARELGFALLDIRALLALRTTGEFTDIKVLASRHLEKVRADLHRTIEIERMLAEAVARCPGGPASGCTVLKMLQTAEQE
jgi:MerR family mercuric resistance operon transcriptional regulator